MAGDTKKEFPPLLAPGFHNMDLPGLGRLCVERFPMSLSRSKLMRNLSEVIDLIQKSSIAGEIWIDGSFLTEKLNPDDVDLLLRISIEQFRSLDPDQRRFFDWFRKTSLYDAHRCDNYAAILDAAAPEAEYVHAYWLKQFGFSRAGGMKGLAVVKVPFLVSA